MILSTRKLNLPRQSVTSKLVFGQSFGILQSMMTLPKQNAGRMTAIKATTTKDRIRSTSEKLEQTT